MGAFAARTRGHARSCADQILVPIAIGTISTVSFWRQRPWSPNPLAKNNWSTEFGEIWRLRRVYGPERDTWTVTFTSARWAFPIRVRVTRRKPTSGERWTTSNEDCNG